MANAIKVSVLGDVKDINQKLGSVEKNVSSMGKTVNSVGRLLKGALLVGAVTAGVGALTNKFKEANAAIQEQQKLAAQTNAVLKSTGNAAHVTAGQVSSLADSIEKKSLFDAEAIQSGENLLLTFTNIQNRAGKGNDIFNQTTQIMADMSQALGQSTSTSALQLGKALNDPIKGVTALQRVGVTFTDAQKKQIETMQKAGDTAGAQKVILAELTKEFGGSAKAAGSTAAGQWKHFKDAIDDVFESIVRKVLPTFTKLVGFLATNLPVAIAAVTPYIKDLVDKVKQLGDFLRTNVLPVLKDVGSFVANNQTAFKALAIAILAIVAAVKIWSAVTKAYTAVQAALNVVMSLNPIGLLILAIVGLVAAFIYLWKTSEKFREVIKGVWEGTKKVFFTVINAIWGFIKKTWPILVAAITGPLGIAVLLIVRNWGKIKSAFSTALNFIKGLISTVWNSITGAIKTSWNAVKNFFVTAWRNIKTTFSTGINNAVTLVKGLPGRIVKGLGNLGSTLLSAGGDLISGFIQGIRNNAGRIISAIKDSITDKLPDFVKKALGIGSPSKVFMAIGQDTVLGFVKGLQPKGVAKASAGLGQAAVRGFRTPSLSSTGRIGGGLGGTTNNYFTIQSLDPRTARDLVVEAMEDSSRVHGPGRMKAALKLT